MAFLDYEVKSEILTCDCGGKYIQVFKYQRKCPRCSDFIMLRKMEIIYSAEVISEITKTCQENVNGQPCGTLIFNSMKMCKSCLAKKTNGRSKDIIG